MSSMLIPLFTDMCNFCKMISVNCDCSLDESGDEDGLIMRSWKPKLSIEWQFVHQGVMRLMHLKFLPEHLSSGFPRQCHADLPWHIEQCMGMLDAHSYDVKLNIDNLTIHVQKYLGKRGDIFAQRLPLSCMPIECEVGWMSAGHKSKSPNYAERVYKCDPGESMGWCNQPSLPLFFDISTKKDINSPTPWPGENVTMSNQNICKLSMASDEGLDSERIGQQLWLQRALTRGIDDFTKLQLSMVQETAACFHTANVEKAQTSVGLVSMDPSNPEELEATVVNYRVQRRNNSGSNGAQAITYSEETDHIPVEHELNTESGLHRQSSNSKSERFAVRPIELHVSYIAKTLVDVISGVLNFAIHVPQSFRGIHFTMRLDHLRAARIYMTTDGAIGHGTDPAIAASGNYDEEFIFDSGAEEHVTGNFALLSRVTAVENGCGVVTASGHFMPALCSGYLIIERFKVKGVLFVPGMTDTIFSVSKLDDLGYSTEFTGGECFVRDVRTNDLVGKGHRVSGLYKVDYLEIPR